MSKSLKIILFAVSGFLGLLVIVAVALLLFVDANAYKPLLEAAALNRYLARRVELRK